MSNSDDELLEMLLGEAGPRAETLNVIEMPMTEPSARQQLTSKELVSVIRATIREELARNEDSRNLKEVDPQNPQECPLPLLVSGKKIFDYYNRVLREESKTAVDSALASRNTPVRDLQKDEIASIKQDALNRVSRKSFATISSNN